MLDNMWHIHTSEVPDRDNNYRENNKHNFPNINTHYYGKNKRQDV